MAAGEALAIASGAGKADADVHNSADGANSVAGNDTIIAGNGDDTLSGGSQAQSAGGLANATTGNLATNGGSAGNDSIVADGGASGDDVVAGDAQALSQSGHALSESVNGPTSTVGQVGNDDIWTRSEERRGGK